MPFLTSYERNQADTWDTGMADSDQADEAQELSGLRNALVLADGLR